MSAPVPAGFIRLESFQDRTPVYLAVEEISRFIVYDKFRPFGGSVVTTTSSSRHHVAESVDEIAARIVAAQTTTCKAAES